MRPHEEAILGIRRRVQDAYDQALVRAASTVLTGAGTRVDAARSALSFLADRGITGFTDRSGRRWDLASYGEMVTRTASGHAAIEGHMD
ncbi:phage minor capsid protein, partial [Klebsiella pneumoniae]|nr:phage minor capsid protein [Klebsiella pneumoniae]